jgi:hypothetical protein
MAELDILQRAEWEDGYRAACAKSPLNWAARKGQVYDLAAISEAATASLTDAARSVPLTRGCEFAILDGSADGGMPHTRAPNVICIPASMCKEGRASKDFLEMLAHEAIHVHQRRAAPVWRQALAAAGWEPLDGGKIPPTVAEIIRINPDTMAAPLWSWNSHHVPLPTFTTKISPGLGDVRIVWMDLRTGALFPTPPPTFGQGAKRSGQGAKRSEPVAAVSAAYEHPYEFYAYTLSQQGIRTQEALEEALRGP